MPKMLFSLLINVKMLTIVGILTFVSMKNFMLSCVEQKFFITSGSGSTSIFFPKGQRIPKAYLFSRHKPKTTGDLFLFFFLQSLKQVNKLPYEPQFDFDTDIGTTMLHIHSCCHIMCTFVRSLNVRQP